jgi:predicted enzyme related to lactoylglutathione lyase
MERDMSSKVSISVDVSDLEQGVDFYVRALQCEQKARYSENWAVVSLDGVDIHLLKQNPGTLGAGAEKRHFDRHWTPVHLDFGVADVAAATEAVERCGGSVERQSSTAAADIACCADPFGNGFCVIRE